MSFSCFDETENNFPQNAINELRVLICEGQILKSLCLLSADFSSISRREDGMNGNVVAFADFGLCCDYYV